MKKKTLTWILAGISLFLLIVSLVISLIVGWAKLKLLFWITLIVVAIFWIIYVIAYFIQLAGKKEPIEKIDVKNAINEEIEDIKNDINCGDNFILKDYELGRYGKSGLESPVVAMWGYLTEQKCNGVSILNLNNKKENSRKRNVTPEYIEKLKNIIAEHPDVERTESIERVDPFGRTFEKVKRPLPSSQKERDEIEKKEAEERSAV